MSFKMREAVVRYKRANGVIESVNSSEEVWRFFSKRIKGETREVFYCLYLSQRNGVLCFEQVSVGISAGTMIDVKGIVRTALLVGAERLIFIHNHPSGDPTLGFSLTIGTPGSHVPHMSLIQVRATFMPDATQTVCRFLLDLSWYPVSYQF